MNLPKPLTVALHNYVLFCRLDAILDFLVSAGLVTNYVTIAKALGLFSGSAVLAKLLGETQVQDKAAGTPIRSSLVVGSGTGMPGLGYFEHLRKLGYSIPKTELDERAFWISQVNALKIVPKAQP